MPILKSYIKDFFKLINALKKPLTIIDLKISILSVQNQLLKKDTISITTRANNVTNTTLILFNVLLMYHIARFIFNALNKY